MAIKNNKPKLPIDVLLTHLKKHKDAVVILGPDLAEDIQPFTITEETKDIYNRKNMIKKPNMFWQFYSNNIKTEEGFTTSSMISIESLLSLGLHSTVIDTNTFTTTKDAIHPNGLVNQIECVKCHKMYNALTMDLNTKDVLKCECGGNLKPTVLCFGEKYSMPLYDSIKNSIFEEKNGRPVLKTHTLIFIGVDFTDSLISEIIDSFDALKDNEHFTVIITDKLNNSDLIYYNPEFGVADKLNEGVDRLIALLEK